MAEVSAGAVPAAAPNAAPQTQGQPQAGAPKAGGGQAPNVAREQAARGESTQTKPPEGGAETKTQPPKQKIREVLKYNGKDVPMEFEDEEHRRREFQRLYGEAQAARKSQQERVEWNKMMEEVKKSKDPFALFRKYVDPEFNRDDYLLNSTKNLLDEEDRKKADPRGWELEQREKALAEREAKLREADEAAEKERTTQRVNEMKQKIAAEWGSKLRRLGYDNDYTKSALIPRMVDLYRANAAAGVEWTTDQMVDHIGWEMMTAGLKHIKSLRGQDLLDALGPELVDEVRRANLTAANAMPPKPAPKPADDEPLLDKRGERAALRDMHRGMGGPWRFGR